MTSLVAADASPPAQVSLPRSAWRLVACLAMLVRGLLTCLFIFPFCSPARRMAHVGRFCDLTLGAMGIRVVTEGAAHPGPVLLAANHVSWLDILAMDAALPARFVSKADIRKWPVIGWMVACGGTLFIERERKRDAMRVVHQVAASLQDGDIVAMFPEGTTSDGHGLLPFHANLLQAAIATHTPVQAVALRYRDAGSPVSRAAAFVGEMSLLESLWLIVRARGLEVQVQRLPAVPTEGWERRALGERLRGDIATALGIDPSAPAHR
jgi:1-acyl-sn-glycerol-3-phosphate acyltransferase